jgi:serine phosphatase RsbU (regulator of sigma subunit)
MMAHTSATGPLPGMYMSQAQAAFRLAAMHMDSPHAFMRSLNILLYEPQEPQTVDCLMALLEPETGKLRLAVAGNIGAYIIGARGDDRRLTPDPLLPPLGAARDSAYSTLAATLEPGETMALFTPGVVTARNLKDMLSDLKNFTEGGSQPDDITVILAHRPD